MLPQQLVSIKAFEYLRANQACDVRVERLELSSIITRTDYKKYTMSPHQEKMKVFSTDTREIFSVRRCRKNSESSTGKVCVSHESDLIPR